MSISYNISEPINVIFPAVKGLCKISKLTGKSYSEIHIVDLGHIVIGNHNIFWTDLRRLICRLPQEYM